MPRIAMDSFADGTEIVRVYLAARLDEAQAVERALDDADQEYAVEVEELVSSTALGLKASRQGAGFWVEAGELERCADALEGAGLVAGLVRR
jgi:hypothetical protein